MPDDSLKYPAMKKAPLLITAALDAGNTPYVALSSMKERTEAHMEGLLAWCREPSITSIIFAKNCAARIRPEVLRATAASYGKELEFVQANASTGTILQGKGFGEGDLIRQALERSNILRNNESFVKVTGKLFCPDIEGMFSHQGSGEFFVGRHASDARVSVIRKAMSPLYRSERGSKLLSLLKRKIRVPWGLLASVPGCLVDTRFYRVNRDFYKEVLGNSYRRVQDGLGYTLEYAFHDDLIPFANRISMKETSLPIIGTSGSLGTTAGEYPDELRSEARQVAARLLC